MNKLESILKLVDLIDEKKETSVGSYFEVGKNYFVRTVTMSIIGELKSINDNEFLFSKASWIADTGRFSNFLKGDYSDSIEVEPYHNDVIIARGALIDATIVKKLLRDQI